MRHKEFEEHKCPGTDVLGKSNHMWEETMQHTS